jgi:hypothetical protein
MRKVLQKENIFSNKLSIFFCLNILEVAMRIRSLLFCLLLSLFAAISINAQSYEYFTAFEGAPAAKAKVIELNLSGAKLVYIGANRFFFDSSNYIDQRCWKGKALNWFYIFTYDNDMRFSFISIIKKEDLFLPEVKINDTIDSLSKAELEHDIKKFDALPENLKNSDAEFIFDSVENRIMTILPDSGLHTIGLSTPDNFRDFGYNFNDKFIWCVYLDYSVDNGFGGSQQGWGILYISAITGEYLGGVFSTDVKDYNNEKSSITITPNPASDYINIVPYTKQILIFNIYGNKVLESEYKDRIDVSGFPAGVYFLKAGNKVYKFIKM